MSDVRAGKLRKPRGYRRTLTGVLIHKTASVDEHAALAHGVRVDRDVTICPGADVREYVIIEPGAVIGQHATLEPYVVIGASAAIAKKAHIGAFAYVGREAIVGDYGYVPPYGFVGPRGRVGRDGYGTRHACFLGYHTSAWYDARGQLSFSPLILGVSPATEEGETCRGRTLRSFQSPNPRGVVCNGQ